MPNFEIIDYPNATGRLKEIYDDLIKTRGKLAEVHKVQSLNPESIVKHMDLYLHVMFGKSPLKRVQREMMAVVVSKTNNCEYCQTHHAEAVLHYWKNPERVEKLKNNFTAAELNPTDLALCEFAQISTLHPGKEKKTIDNLKTLGLTDRAILDATLVIAYFNFVNRIVLAGGIGLEDEPGGYEYE